MKYRRTNQPTGLNHKANHKTNHSSPISKLPDKPLLTPQDIKSIFDIQRATVEQWRFKGIGPKFVRLTGSRLIRYRREDVENYIEALIAVRSTNEANYLKNEEK